MNAIDMLKADHRKVEALFTKFETAMKKKHVPQMAALADKIVGGLTIHAAIEEAAMYPKTKAMAEIEDLTLEAYEEHHLVKRSIAEIGQMRPEDERFGAKVKVLGECVKHHVKEEERELFPKMRKLFGKAGLEELGVELAKAKRRFTRDGVPAALTEERPSTSLRKSNGAPSREARP